MKLSSFKVIQILLVLFCVYSCKKESFLDARPNQALVVPQTISDFQAILDKDQYMNGTAGLGGVVPSLGEVGTDGYYVTTDDLNGLVPPLERNAYSWQKDVFTGDPVTDWNFPYRAVYYANVALDGMSKITPAVNEQQAWNNVKGSALFYRAHMFYQLAQVFAPAYDTGSAASDYGIPLRLGADVNEKISRATLRVTYDQIINDLLSCITLLPKTPLYKTRPSKAAAYGLLARIYQTTEDYSKSLLYADSCLQISNSLIDFNTLDSTSYTPIPRFNSEVIFHAILVSHTVVSPYVAAVDTGIYNSYDINDLRKTIFFTPGASGGGLAFRGTYDGSYDLFGGIAVDEIYLIKAECYARGGNTGEALTALNSLLITRWRTGTFKPYTAANPTEALTKILRERKKELMFRALRWTDLRRLNTDARFAYALKRTPPDQQTYTLQPLDLRYTYPIPQDVISFNPGMPQNPR